MIIPIEILLWLGLIVSVLVAIYISFQSMLAGMFPNRFVEIMWMVVGVFVMAIFFKGVIDYLVSNTEMLIVIGILIVFYFLLNPLSIDKVKKVRGKKK